MIPFFVADRPMSLRLLKGLPLQDYSGVRIGIMAHANTTQSFQQAFRQYPCDKLEYCDALGAACRYRDDLCLCSIRNYILNHTVKMCDSGIFTREGATLTYDQLLKAYDQMGVQYGVMIDVFRDPEATLRSAERALEAYGPYRDSFSLVAVAHGATVEEYVESYSALKEMGFTHVAVGGLLQKIGKSVRYTQVREESFMYLVLETLRAAHPDDWLFALGSFHPSRIDEFSRLGVWGDYKGWIFKYKKRNETLSNHIERFAANHLRHMSFEQGTGDKHVLQRVIALRDAVLERWSNLSQRLLAGKKMLRSELRSLHQQLQREDSEMADRFEVLTTHALLDASEEKLVNEALRVLGKERSDEARSIWFNVAMNRGLKRRVHLAEDRIDKVNDLLAKKMKELATQVVGLPEQTRQTCDTIVSLATKTERQHRFEQVRGRIAEEILARL